MQEADAQDPAKRGSGSLSPTVAEPPSWASGHRRAGAHF